jgi:peroxiredoxin
MKTYFSYLLIAVFAFLFIAAAPDAGYKPGDKARDFKLKNIDGKMVSLSDYKDAKGFILTFTCNHCPFAKAYEERIIALNSKYAAKGYPVIAINPNDPNREPDDSFDNMVMRAKDKKYSFPYLFDESQEIAKAYGATRTPHIFILSKKGNELTVEYVGAIDDNADDASAVKTKYTENALDQLLAGKKAEPNLTKAVGCTIKWKPAN